MRPLRLCVVVVLALLVAGVAAGQRIPTGTLTGTVSDASGPLPGAAVS